MLRGKLVSVLLAVTMTVTLASAAMAAAQDGRVLGADSELVAPKVALVVAERFLDHFSKIEPRWKNALPHDPVLFHTPDGNPGVYVATVSVDGKAIGYIVIGATRDRSPIISIGTGPVPISLADSVRSELTKALQSEEGLGSPRYIYGGPSFLMIEYPVIKNREVTKKLTYHLQGNFRVDDVPSPISLKERIPQHRKAWDEWLAGAAPMAYYHRDLGVRSYEQSEDNGCGPVAGANILNYWDERGYTDLQDDDDRTTGAVLINHLFTDMGTTSAGTTYSNWCAGMERHANQCNEYNFDSFYELWDDSSSHREYIWEEMVLEINSLRPFGMWFRLGDTPYSWHIVACRGYYYDDTTRLYHVNTWGYSEYNDYDETSGFHMMYVRPG